MPHITTCPRCGQGYAEDSEEKANSPSRLCLNCAGFLDFAKGGRTPPDDQLTWYRFGKNGRKVPCDPPSFQPSKVAA